MSNFVSFGMRGTCSYCREVVEEFRVRGIEDWARLSLDDERNRFPDGYICSVTRGHRVFEALKRFVEEYGVRSCAELSGMEAIADLYGFDLGGARIYLYPSKTCNSLLCANVIADVLREKGIYTEVIPIKSVRSVDEFEEFVVEVLDKVVKRVVDEKKRGSRIYVNATPGFKAETSFLVLASILSGVDGIVYIHEAFRRGIALPIPPIALDIRALEELKKLFRDRECVDYGYAVDTLTEARVVDFIDRGIAVKRYGELCIRRWVSRLLELYS